MTDPTSTSQRRDLEAAYRVFQRFALEDQRAYYVAAVNRYRRAADQVNRLRALLALFGGLSAALAGLLVSAYLATGGFVSGGTCSHRPTPEAGILRGDAETAGSESTSSRPGYCVVVEGAVIALTVVAIVAPAAGAAFTTVADLYQWDRLASIYETALENLEVADAQSPVSDMNDLEYRAYFRGYAESALAVMEDEAAQWGQVSQPPPQIEKFIEEERQKAARVGGSADDLVPGRPSAPPLDAQQPG